MRHPLLNLVRRTAWRLAKPVAPALVAKASGEGEATALGKLLGLTGPELRPDWVGLAFNSRYGGRFKYPGVFGALFAALTKSAAVAEASCNWAKTYAHSSVWNPPGTPLLLTILRLKLTGRFRDVRKGHPALHDPESHHASQVFGLEAQSEGWDGIAYRSVRARPRGTCVVVFRKAVVVSCVEVGRVHLVWDGVAFKPEGLVP